MSSSVILIGGPDTGKTNFLARMVLHLRDGKGALRAVSLPDDIQYIEDALAYLMKGEFAPRSHNTTGEVSGVVEITVAVSEGAEEVATLVVPDVSGETWDEVARSAEISQDWLDRIRTASGALLFVRVLSELNVAPMDWVNAPKLLALAGPADNFAVPTQVILCEFLRLLEENAAREGDQTPRVAIILTAYDRLDEETRKLGPRTFLESAFPLFAGKIANTSRLDVGVFGASVVGGELADAKFKNRYLQGDIASSGYIIDDTGSQPEETSDFSRPISWVLNISNAS